MNIHRAARRRLVAFVVSASFAVSQAFAATPAPDTIEALGLSPPPTVAGAHGRDAKSGPRPKSTAVAGLAASWLVAQQRGDGAFPWTPGNPSVFTNTQGATALGLLRAFERTGVAGQRDAALANGGCQLAANACIPGFLYPDPTPSRHRFATHDPLFLEALTAVTGNPAYAAYVDTHFWSDLTAGTYGPNADLDAGEFANVVLTTRTSQGIPELVPWDLSKLVLAASVAGETTARDAFVAASLAGLEAAGPGNDTYDVVGLAGAIWAAATAGVPLDPTAGTFEPADSVAELASALLAFRAPSGGFVTGSAEAVVDANASAQSTAYAMLALHAADPALYRNQIASGFGFLLSLQQASGQFLAYPGAPVDAAGGVEGQGETLEAYAIVVMGDVYVDDNWTSLPNGTVVPVTHPLVASGTVATVGVDAFATIGGGTAAVAPGQTVYVSAGSYGENVSIGKPLQLLGAAAADTVLDGTARTGSGLTIAPNVTNVTIEDLTVRNFTQINTSGGACIYGALANSDTTIRRTIVHGCATGRGGIFLSGGGAIDDIVISDNEVFSTDGRGIVIWDGAKTDITITGNDVHDLTGCCGIELQDGTASGVLVTGNTVTNVGDSGMGFVQLGGTHGPNLIANNTLSNTGRFGIELKIPDGTGVDSDTAPGAIVVRNNSVTGPTTPASGDARDRAGIAVIRRAFCPTCAETDVTRGVVVRDNVVTGWRQPSANDGFGLVIEGTRSVSSGNQLVDNDVGAQLQQGNDGFPGDSNQAAVNDFFSRGNAPQTCVRVLANTFTGNGIAQRSVSPTGANLTAVARNTTSGAEFCSVQAAIDAATAGETIEVYAGARVAEALVIGKALTLRGLGTMSGRPELTLGSGATDQAIVRVANAQNVTIENLRFLADQTYVGPAITTSGEIAGLVVRGNEFEAGASNPAVRTAFGQRNAIEVNPNRDGTAVNGGAGLVTIEDNEVTGSLASPTQPIYFRAGLWIEGAGGTVAGNVFRAGFYDALVRFTTSPTTLSNNEFRGAGVQVTEANVPGPVTIDGNLFDPDQTRYPAVDPANGNAPIPFGDPRLGTAAVMLKLQNPNGAPSFAPLVVSGNTFTDHVIGIWGQNAADFALTNNTFTPRAGATDFVHLVLSNKSGSSNSHQLAPLPLAITATGNTFNSLGANVGTHVALWNHAATFAGNPAPYGTLSFSSNAFAGQPAFYFDLDDAQCASSQTLACVPAVAAVLGYAGYPATPVAPFAGNVSAASNTYAGVAPAAMNVLQRVALQERTFHNDPAARDRADLGTALGIVDYGALAAPAVALTLAADGANDGYTRADQQFTTTVANTGGMVQERVKLRTTLTRLSTGPIVLDGALSDGEGDDVRLEFADPDCTIASGNRVDGRCIARLMPVTGGQSVGYVFPQINPGFHLPGAITLPSGTGWSFYRKPGRFTVVLELYGESSGTVYAQTGITNFLVRQPIDVTLAAGDLAQVFDGTPRTVAFTASSDASQVRLRYTGTDTAGAPYDATTAPVNAGTYGVVAETTGDELYAVRSQSPDPATLVVSRAPVTLTLSDLVQIANGTPRPVTVQASVAGVAFTVTYDGSTTAPSAPGSYAVVATVTNPNYEGTASGTLVIQPGAAGSLAAQGGTSFAGTAGLALTGALPSVIVRDVNGALLADTTVVFEVTAGGGSLAMATVQTDAGGIATLGGWTLGRDAGNNAVAARLPGSSSIAAVEFTATGAEVTDLAVTKTTTTPTPSQDAIANFTIVVSNLGPSNAAAVAVLDALPAGLDAGTAQWLCVAGGGGASCGAASAGGGDISIDDAVIPVGGNVTVVVSATVTGTPGAVITNVAAADALSGTDPNAANDSDDASITVGSDPGAPVDPLFMDGFEDAAAVPAVASGKVLSLSAPAVAAHAPAAVVVLVDAHGSARATLDAMPGTNGTAWRVRAADADGVERASAWLVAPAYGTYAGGVTLARDAGGLRIAVPGSGDGLLVPDATIETAQTLH